MTQTVRKVVIAGGGTAGWITAATLSSQLGPLLDITLVESDDIRTVGVGEATIPTQKSFHRLLGINEQEFMRATRASFKLGIAFENWGQVGERYIHSFGKVGRSSWMGDFQHMWHHAHAQGWAGPMDDYCFELQAAEAGKFATSEDAQISYAYHLDASLYAKFLRTFSEQHGAKRTEGKIQQVNTHADTGFIKSLTLESGENIEGDLFIDCTGFRGLLINETLNVGFDDWSHWLPMNSAFAVQTETEQEEAILPYTRSIAREAGWQWRIPLQHRVGNGHVYASDHMSDDEAHHILMNNLNGRPITEARPIRFTTGKRKEVWAKNCIALGLSSGFLEPLESTSIHLIQIGATRLVQMFPFSGVNPAIRQHYNAYANEELDSIRDFLILHYKLNRRQDTKFWQERAALDIPDSLAHRIDLYKNNAIAYQDDSDLFRVDSWNQVMRGQGLKSRGYHHMGQLVADDQLKGALTDLKANIDRTVASMPSHAEFLRQYCAAEA